jgi:hypothetical protein
MVFIPSPHTVVLGVGVVTGTVRGVELVGFEVLKVVAAV